MTRRECLARLALEPVGRLIVPRDDLPPIVVPAIYRLAGEALLVRTARALPPARVHPRRFVFEVDRIEADRRRGWSVVVECVAREGSPTDATTDDDGWLWLSIEVVRGRRLGAGAPPDPGDGLVTVRDLARDDGLDELTADECSALLAQHHLGRLGLTSASLPVILPTSFAMDGDAPMFWTGEGLKLHAARNGHVACLEIDGHDDLEQSGWSVLVIGRLAEIVGARQRSRYEHVPIPRWRHIDRLAPDPAGAHARVRPSPQRRRPRPRRGSTQRGMVTPADRVGGESSAPDPSGHTGPVATRAFLLDDHEIVRRGVRDLLEASGIEVVGEAGTAAEALSRIPPTRPDVALLDVRLPDGNGVEVCREIRSAHPEIRCVMLTSFEDDEALVDCVVAGASGYLLKQVRGNDIVDAVERVAAGESLLDPALVAKVKARLRSGPEVDERLASLTPQERRVLDLIADGLTNKEIAEQLYLAPKTVKNYVSNVLLKTGMRGRTEAAVYLATHPDHAGPSGG